MWRTCAKGFARPLGRHTQARASATVTLERTSLTDIRAACILEQKPRSSGTATGVEQALDPPGPARAAHALEQRSAGAAHPGCDCAGHFRLYLPLLVQQQLPTAQELIAAALKAGRIDYGTSLLYHEERLPQQFWGAGSSGEDERLFYEATEPLGPIQPMSQLNSIPS